MDLPSAGLEQGAEALEDDLVVVDESDLDGFRHTSILGRSRRDSGGGIAIRNAIAALSI
jgi:hypothetical protein